MNKCNYDYCEKCGSLVQEGVNLCWLCRQKAKETGGNQTHDIAAKSKPAGWCPMCNKAIAVGQKKCICDWLVRAPGLMAHKCSGELFALCKPFIDEYRQWLAEGTIKSGYEYSQIKIVNLPFGRMLKKKWDKSEKIQCPF